VASAVEIAAMGRAREAAVSAWGRTSPNPPVGAVILDRNGTVVGVGATAPAGGPHAEVGALAAAGGRARGGTAVVTLEPCAHHGRTPPCTGALLAAGIARVVVAVRDPNPVAAGGATVLAEAGVDVETGVQTEAAEQGALRAWLHRVRTGRPHVTWKLAATLDGRVAAADGSSRWITGPEARHEVHLLRSRVDAVVVGAGTALADDPSLTVRLDGFDPATGPRRVVVGRRPLSPGSVLALAAVSGEHPQVLTVATHDPDEVLAELAGTGVVSVLLEGGPTLAGAFWAAGRVDLVVAHLAPALLGAGPAALGAAGVGSIGEILRLDLQSVDRIGADVQLVAVPASSGSVPGVLGLSTVRE
jgi:diaminohydroxyphosphoribosylaminopyrimidine deaminase/5-amino-6-(5-phosphoribosylamino)uracil reductase